MKSLKRTVALIFLLLFAGIFLPGTRIHAATDSSMSFDFVLTSGGKKTLTAELGDILDIQLELKRVDPGKSGSFTLHSMQAELIFDSRYFAFVNGSREVAPSFDANLNYLGDGHHLRFIVSRVVMNPNGAQVEDELLLLKFRLEALAEVKDGPVTCVNYKVNSWSGDSYLSTGNDLMITVKGPGPIHYTINFEKGDEKAWGSAPLQEALAQGNSLVLPDNTFHNEGYLFAGWHDGQKRYGAGDLFTMPGKAVTFTALWEEARPPTEPPVSPPLTSETRPSLETSETFEESSQPTRETDPLNPPPVTGEVTAPSSTLAPTGLQEGAAGFDLVIDEDDMEERKVSLEESEEGFEIRGEDLSGLTLHIRKGGKDHKLILDTDEKRVLVKERPDGSLEVLVDKDKDGVFETPIARTEGSEAKSPLWLLIGGIALILVAGRVALLAYRRRKDKEV